MKRVARWSEHRERERERESRGAITSRQLCIHAILPRTFNRLTLPVSSLSLSLYVSLSLSLSLIVSCLVYHVS